MINAAALACAILVLLAIDNFSPLTRVNQLLQDWEIASSFAAPMPQDTSIVIVAIDEDTLRQFPYRSPVDRKYVSDLIQALERHGPAVIGVDLLFDQPTEDNKDATLHQTLVNAKVPLVVS
ncbi:MAG TPA: CHASE2 domain-containing protein, partial [Rhizomicrobium sp.]